MCIRNPDQLPLIPLSLHRGIHLLSRLLRPLLLCAVAMRIPSLCWACSTVRFVVLLIIFYKSFIHLF